MPYFLKRPSALGARVSPPAVSPTPNVSPATNKQVANDPAAEDSRAPKQSNAAEDSRAPKQSNAAGTAAPPVKAGITVATCRTLMTKRKSKPSPIALPIHCRKIFSNVKSPNPTPPMATPPTVNASKIILTAAMAPAVSRFPKSEI